MIVSGMTEKEIKAEMLVDISNAFRYCDTRDQKFRRMVIKTSRFPVYAHSYYLSPRKNKWIILFEARDKKEIGDKSRITFVATWDSPHGIYAIMASCPNENIKLFFYPPHFFSRYAERMDLKIHGIDLIMRYFKLNNCYVFTEKEINISGNSKKIEVYASGEEGAALGFLTKEGNIMFKTFITYGMTKGEQIDLFVQNDQIRKEILNT